MAKLKCIYYFFAVNWNDLEPNICLTVGLIIECGIRFDILFTPVAPSIK